MKQKNKREDIQVCCQALEGASLLGNLLSGKGIRADSENKKGKGIVRAGYGNKMNF